jgi:phosphoribosylformylglycinamidine synthase
VAVLHDKMTQCRYIAPLTSFATIKKPEHWYEVDIVGKGRAALEQVNDHLGKNCYNYHIDLKFYEFVINEKSHEIVSVYG